MLSSVSAPTATDVTEDRVPLVSRAMGIALLGVGLLVAAVVGWAVFGQAPDTISGRGVILPTGGYAEVGTRNDGVVETINVTPGDRIESGTTVAVLTNPDGTSTDIATPVGGVVIEVRARQGRVSATGDPLVIIEPSAATPVVKAFLPAGEGEVVKPGMRALVTPGGVSSSQYGYIKGKVSQVSPAPVSPDRLAALLGDNASLVDFLLESGPVLEMNIVMEQADTPSGYAWTIGTGPDQVIDSSTLVDVTVVVRERKVMGWMLR